MNEALTAAEERAELATKLSAFPINLADIRRQVQDVLTEFGRYGFFEEYTNHSFTHVQDMLANYDWLVPEKAKLAMSGADWLLLVLSTYLHDLGLIVTRSEFSRRGSSDFKSFCETVLFSGEGAEDYKARVYRLEEPVREKFLYEEFVRYHHAVRVRSWIEGTPDKRPGDASEARKIVSKMLEPLPASVRKDLGLLCESHNLDDLDDFQKYRTSQPYGPDRASVANLHFVGLLLRTADLLSITNKRTPSVLFKLVNPTDPVSQVEWQRHGSVLQVRSKIGTDEEGLPDANAPRHTVEIFANFETELGFFGLDAYLRYARDQLGRSYASFQKSQKRLERPYDFPWRFVDDENILTAGFQKRKLGFEIDQEKILTLLTGHTLYNDSTVALRELAQNAIDAVRLQALEERSDARTTGQILVRWDSAKRELSVMDNGTGMTQEIIERHLLKVGSSRYQDQKFIEEHPDFSPISRFGIGVLSAFMVADDVEITTISDEDEEAKQISLRSVHGQYLVRLLPKDDPCLSLINTSHGTTFKLRLRPSAKLDDVLAIMRRWVKFPNCSFVVQIDGNPPAPVGVLSPKEALEEYLQSFDGKKLVGSRPWKVEMRDVGGVSLAYALAHSYYYKEWSFVSTGRPAADERERPPVGVYVEGIGVDFGTPGYRGGGILALANATGPLAPKTNVARSALEDTPERAALYANVYAILVAHVADELERLRSQESYSVTSATKEAPFLLSPLMSGQPEVADPDGLQRAVQTLPLALIEDEGGRRAVPTSELGAYDSMWSVESPLLGSIERLVKEARANITARSVISLTRPGQEVLPSGVVICNLDVAYVRSFIGERYDVSRIEQGAEDRQVNLEWTRRSADSKWLFDDLRTFDFDLPTIRTLYQISDHFRQRGSDRSWLDMVAVPRVPVDLSGFAGFGAVESFGTLWILPNTAIACFIRTLFEDSSTDARMRCYSYMTSLMSAFGDYGDDEPDVAAKMTRLFRQLDGAQIRIDFPDFDQFIEAVVASPVRKFNPWSWSRHGAGML